MFTPLRLLPLVLCFSAHPLYAATFGKLTYKIVGQSITITDCDETAKGTINIPENIAGKPVTSIGEEAFNNCESLESVVIPKSVTTIEKEAFYGCGKLKGIALPQGLRLIGNGGFGACSKLESLVIPGSVTTIGTQVFTECFSLKSIEVHGSNPNYSGRDGVLFNKDQTRLIAFPPGKGGDYRIPETVRTFGKGAFYACFAITGVFVPSDVQSVGRVAFPACKNLAFIEVSAANRHYSDIDGVLFNKKLTSLIQFPGGRKGPYTIPSIASSLMPGAFFYCLGLTHVTIPEGVTSISEAAFLACPELTGVDLPESVTSIREDAFSACAKLARISFGPRLVSIGRGSFTGCKALKTLVIPASVRVIGAYAFQSCNSLRRATFLGTAPKLKRESYFGNPDQPIMDVFENTANSFTIRFIEGSDGFTTPKWNGYRSVAISEAPAPVVP